MRALFVATVFFYAFLPASTHAQKLDPRCFNIGDCYTTRSQLNDELKLGVPKAEIDSGFYQGTDAIKACGGAKLAKEKKLGFCPSLTAVTTEISFGQKNTFLNLPDFIRYIYRYGVMVISILAVIVIIFAGIQWMAAAGNSAVITSAKKRIAGALTGMALALLSYFLLNTINPFLVNLRLPQVWMIKQQDLGSKWCRFQSNQLSLKTSDPNGYVDAEYSFYGEFIKTGDPDKTALCGKEYWIENTNGSSCLGSYCKEAGAGLPKVCKDNNSGSEPMDLAKFVCETGSISGKIYQTKSSKSLEEEGWTDPFIDELHLAVLCNDGYMIQVDTSGSGNITKISDQQYSYTIEVEQSGAIAKALNDTYKDIIDEKDAIVECSYHGQINGFVLIGFLDENDDADESMRFIGIGPGGLGLDVGINVAGMEKKDFPECGFMAQKSYNECFMSTMDQIYPKLKNLPKNYLFSHDDLIYGTALDIDVNNDHFPPD